MVADHESPDSSGQNQADTQSRSNDDILEVSHWQQDHIRKALRQADAGDLVFNDEVVAAFERWRS